MKILKKLGIIGVSAAVVLVGIMSVNPSTVSACGGCGCGYGYGYGGGNINGGYNVPFSPY